MKFLKFTSVLLILCFLTVVGEASETKNGPFTFLKNKDWQFVPVPVWESRPDEGNTFGVMPVLLMSDKGEEAIKAIFAMMAQYNTVTKFDGVALAYFYPEPEQEITFYAEVAQKFAREFSTSFLDPHFNNFYIDVKGGYIQSPFGRFFGYGPTPLESDQSNYLQAQYFFDAKLGYYLFENFRANYGFHWHKMDIKNRAITKVQDTLATYGALPGVADSNNFIHEASITFDNRKDGDYSRSGTFAESRLFGSSSALGSDATFHGIQLEFIQLFPWSKPYMTTAFRTNVQQMFGTGIPFYEQSSLGGGDEMRNYVSGRYVDRGKMVFQLEQRVRALHMRLFDKSFDINIDPFFELGRVFENFNELGFNRWQPIGGVGFRLFVPPNVIGRLDMAVGSDGFEIYTELGYPF